MSPFFVVFLWQVTAAKGAESFYSLSNSTSRSEDVELAKELDEKVMRVSIFSKHYSGIPLRLVFIENIFLN